MREKESHFRRAAAKVCAYACLYHYRHHASHAMVRYAAFVKMPRKTGKGKAACRYKVRKRNAPVRQNVTTKQKRQSRCAKCRLRQSKEGHAGSSACVRTPMPVVPASPSRHYHYEQGEMDRELDELTACHYRRKQVMLMQNRLVKNQVGCGCSGNRVNISCLCYVGRRRWEFCPEQFA